MILSVQGDVGLTYCQNLCLIFFPGARFPRDEKPGPGVPEASVELREEAGKLLAFVRLLSDGSAAEGTASTVPSDFVSYDRAVKTVVGEAFLEAGCRLSGQLPPWGILTGVRPTKIAAEMRRRGLACEAVADALCREFHVRPDKAALLADVTETQAALAPLAGPGTCSLYVSVPFCPTRCRYCSFVSYATPRYLAMLPDYLEQLCRDIEAVCAGIRERGEHLTTVYVGGGTPTVLSADQLRKLLSAITASADLSGLLEFTVEAGRPDTVTREKCDVMLANGVTRTSINPQILDDGVLRLIGRQHTSEDFLRAFRLAREAGFRVINTDLIAGLPGASEESFRATVDTVAALAPENVTVHTYCVKRAASFTEEAAENGDALGIYSFSGGDTGDCLDYASHTLRKAGYRPYYLYRQKNARGNLENVGYCLPGTEGLYNVFIMEEWQDIHAVGAGAVSKRIGGRGEKIRRIFEPKYSYEYLNRNDPGLSGHERKPLP